jgi:hypothetical protein
MAGADHEFIGYVLHETGRAILFQDHYWTGPNWMPKSQTTLFTEPDTDEVRLHATEWICGKNNVVEFTQWSPPAQESTNVR